MSAVQSLVMQPSAGETLLARDVVAATQGDREAYGGGSSTVRATW